VQQVQMVLQEQLVLLVQQVLQVQMALQVLKVMLVQQVLKVQLAQQVKVLQGPQVQAVLPALKVL
jgi:hypothetical protein